MGCPTGKQSYSSKDLAETALAFAQLNAKRGRKKPRRVFHCDMCGRYHLTSQEEKGK